MTEAILIFFTFLCLTQVVTHWSVFAKILKHKANVQHPEKSVSVIVAARNEVENLPALIDSIASQKHSNFELIIVNDRSTDGSKDVLTYYEAIFDWLVVIHIDTLPTGWTGKKHAIRKGMESSSKEVLLFTDADCIADSEDWISKMTLTLKYEYKPDGDEIITRRRGSLRPRFPRPTRAPATPRPAP